MKKTLFLIAVLAVAGVLIAEPTIADMYSALPDLLPRTVHAQQAATDEAAMTLIRLFFSGMF